MVSDLLMRRLTIARYLFQMGVEQSHRGEPFGALAISPLHDAVELFLQAGLEHKEGTLVGKTDFLAYWAALKQKGIELSHYEPMKRFNEARVALKHRGTLPAHTHVEEFRQIVGRFFEENSPILFELPFSEISLSGLVNNELVRDSSRLAEKAIRDGDSTSALEEAAKAYRRTLSEYRYGRLGRGSRDQLYLPAEDLSTTLRFALSEFSEFSSRRLGETIQDVIDELSAAITVVAYNLDFDGYRYLMTYGPATHETVGGDLTVMWISVPKADIKIATRCVDFAIDAALRLQSKQSASEEVGEPK